jgi:hypothetical protein
MTRTERREAERNVLGRALQYDIRLVHWNTSDRPSVFYWWWNARHFGPEFPARRDAIDWMASWLDADTPTGIAMLPQE